MEYKKKLIEVALPLEAINKASAREKSIRHGHPSTLHLWWARRPLAAARAVIWSSLVDDPSSHLEKFPTEEEQSVERMRLFKILEEMVTWENINNKAVLDVAKEEIMKFTDGNPPALLDPFAGGGTIPVEAQRLGLEAYASDLNPVAVMINKAMIEIPPKFAGRPPVNPESRVNSMKEVWEGAMGLAEDVRYYGEWMKKEAFKRIGHLYPKINDENGQEHTVIAWIWTRTVKCPNPACGCEMPLAGSFKLSKKKGKEAYIQPIIDGKNIKYEVKYGKDVSKSPKTGRGKFKCICCETPVQGDYIKAEGKENRIGSKLMAIIAEGNSERLFFSPNKEHINVANCSEPKWKPEGEMVGKSADQLPLYGYKTYSDLFTNRQITNLTTFSELVEEAQQKVIEDAIAAGMSNDYVTIDKDGTGATAYGQAIGVYLAFAVDREANYSSSLNTWAGDFIVQTFGRQALAMVWDYAESNPFSNSTGNWMGAINWVALSIENLPSYGIAHTRQFDAQSDNGLRNVIVSTDPPYYNNIIYADLSDFFYVWLRNSIKNTYPKLFRTMLVPKTEELVASLYRFDGNAEKAKEFFEDGMYRACKQLYLYTSDDYPVTIYYAFKQSDIELTEDGEKTTSSGWETMLSAIINAGFSITGTWPIHTERETGLKASVNSLASSIVLACRKRINNAPICTRRELINALKRELKPALISMQKANIAPVDLAQAAIGPGMSVFSKFSKVLEANGKPMSVRSALQIINQELDFYFSNQDGELDRDSRFCVDLYSQYAFNEIKFGDADILARAKNTSVEKLAGRGVLNAQKGMVRLFTREEISENVDSSEPIVWLLTQQLTYAMETGGIVETAKIVADIIGTNAEHAKDLAYRLYTIADRKGWVSEAYAYNSLVIGWPEVQFKATEIAVKKKNRKQISFLNEFDNNEEE